MGATPNLKLKTISPTDNMLVKDFFQEQAGDVSTSNMQKIDKAVTAVKATADGAAQKSVYDPTGEISTAGGIAAWIEKTYENAEVTKY